MLTTITAAALRQAADIKDRIAGLEKDLIRTLSGKARKAHAKPAHMERRRMSPEARAKIAAAAKLRWAKAKRAGRKHL